MESPAETAPPAAQGIHIVVNGEGRRLDAALSVHELLCRIGLNPAKVAVELNREILARSTFADVVLADGDTLEIVHFVGGGA
ncbi:MAG: sulfur carrier protein ThiS [Sphingomonadaceae bacterium]|nr:sulfur carrier protein ThiS [Sphingomonadaceae bacterium]